MLPKILPLMLLLILFSSDSALAGRHRRCCRRCPCCASIETKGPNYCLQDEELEFDDGYLYDGITYDLGCPNNGYEDLYVGNAHYYLPESCYGDAQHKCESVSKEQKRAGTYGHNQTFNTKAQACDYLNQHYPHANGTSHRPCDYYQVQLGATTYHVVLIKAHAPNQGGNHLYFGVETEPLSISPDDTPSFISPTVRGSTLTFDYILHNGTRRHATVWLK
jgi:hypothetical protein